MSLVTYIRRLSSPLHLLVMALSGILLFGLFFLEFSIGWFEIMAAVSTAALTELILQRLTGKPRAFPLSAIAAALGICIFLRASNPWFFAFAAFIAIASKYVLTTKQGHIFNPSNLGVLTTVFVFSAHSTIEFTQWGSDPFVHLIIAAVILEVARRARVLPTTFAFIFTYTLLLVMLIPYAPDRLSAHHYGIIGPSLVLFAAFMITDPRTAPTEIRTRILHGSSVAMTYFILELIGVRYALFLSSLVVTLLNLSTTTFFNFFPAAAPKVRNLYTWLAAFLVIGTLGVNIVINNSMLHSPLRISPTFIFQGIEGGPLLTCTDRPLLRDSTASAGLTRSADYTSGAAWGDYDNDGDDDLFVSAVTKPAALYRNDDGIFTDVADELGLGGLYPSSSYFADFDNDGDLDLFLSGPLKPRVLRSASQKDDFQRFIDDAQTDQLLKIFENVEGRFVDVTSSLISADLTVGTNWKSSSMTFADFDVDGDLDFVLAFRDDTIQLPLSGHRSALIKSLYDPFFENINTMSCSPDDLRAVLSPYAEQAFLTNSDIEKYIDDEGCVSVFDSLPLYESVASDSLQQKTFGPSPYILLIKPGHVYLFENEGGNFKKHETLDDLARLRLPDEQSTTREPTQVYDKISGQFYQPTALDYNGDGLMDIFLAIDFGTNLLFMNNGDLNFTDVTNEAGLNRNGTGMGVAVSDIDQDTLPDIFVTNVLDDYLFFGSGDQRFTQNKRSLGVLGVGWGVVAFDYDLDGWDDLMVASGDMGITQDIPFGNVGRPFFRANQLYRNDNGTLVNTTGTDFCPDFQSSIALAVSDYDNDGDPDVYVGNRMIYHSEYASPVLYTNEIDNGNYLRIKLRGKESNSYGVGAKITVEDPSGLTQTKFVSLGSSFYSQNSLTQLFGFAETGSVRVSVTWPTGQIEVFEDVALNQTLIITES